MRPLHPGSAALIRLQRLAPCECGRQLIVAGADKQFELSAAGNAWFAVIGVDVAAIKPTRHGLARQCLDWTERSHHLAGPLGVQLMRALCAAGWLRRSPSSRAVQVTPKGWAGLKAQLGIDQNSAALITQPT
ncbi:transcriptional regulator, ArsR family [Collimonas fungivorans Ter331]|uniref:Transcriptional regulator, ArsR family n=1 Tax=Collimonas fungivorans (strain Ter331) TaxID=1005048 RepID=G0AA76_COLFT|nr:transcriptional regulator, ArsR family [Collimonas fungivorans Ter331]